VDHVGGLSDSAHGDSLDDLFEQVIVGQEGKDKRIDFQFAR
jgi:hypothetical protein